MPRFCWQNGPFTKDGCSTSCILDEGHEGKHEWTRDDEIRISTTPAKRRDDHPEGER